MAVSSVDNMNRSAVGTGSSASDLTSSFMTLLVAQMKNQDPTNPMDNNQLTSQLAQFNTAAGVEKLNSSVAGVQVMMEALGNMSATSWIGRNVLIEGDPEITTGPAAPEGEGTSESFNFYLKGDADTVTVTLTDADDNAYTAKLKNVKEGVKKYSLDDLTGFEPAPPNPDTKYTVTFDATSAEGEQPEVTALIQEQVKGATIQGGGVMLYLNDNKTIGMNEVFVIQQ